MAPAASLAAHCRVEAASYEAFASTVSSEFGMKMPEVGVAWSRERAKLRHASPSWTSLQREGAAPTRYDAVKEEVPVEAAQPKARTTPVRVLCLHGTCASGSVLKKQLARLQMLVRGKMELVYVDGPIQAVEGTPGFAEMSAAFKGMDFFDYARMSSETDTPERIELEKHIPDPGALMQYLVSNPAEHYRVSPLRTYHEIGTALEFLQEQLKASAPIDGVMGFGGGANMASLLAAQSCAGVGQQIQFVVHLCPGRPGWVPDFPDLFAQPMKIKSLHISGKLDTLNPPLPLKDLYEDPACIVHEDGHRPIPGTSAEEANYIAQSIVDFIVESAP